MFALMVNLAILLSYLHAYDVKPTQSKTSVRYLESNSWQINMGSIEIMLDPILYAPLDFGIPALYTGKKRRIDGVKEMQSLVKSSDYCLLSQGLDDHAHTPTLKALAKLKPNLVYIAPPSAVSTMIKCGIKSGFINTLKPGQQMRLEKDSTFLDIIATTGALVGPPWQEPENGYILKPGFGPSLYYEPHCMYDEGELARYQADYVITPVVAQQLPFFTLVAGREKSVRLAELLKAKAIIPMANGELDQSGPLSKIIKSEGSLEEIQQIIDARSLKLDLIDVVPGVVIGLPHKSSPALVRASAAS